MWYLPDVQKHDDFKSFNASRLLTGAPGQQAATLTAVE